MSNSQFTAPTPEAMNSLLPAFDFTDILTSNASGAVYLANQTSLDRQVAIKVFSPELGEDPHFRKAFGGASRAVAGLSHPNLIGIIDSGQANDMPYTVMEFVPGKSLARSTRGVVVDFQQSMALIGGICDGLAYAHGKGLIHGNLSPLNILLNQKAEPKIGNFGLDRPVHTDASVEVPTRFTAPEVLADSNAATKRSDVFSVGAIFYELITGRPFAADAPPASSLVSCKPAVDAVLREATDPDPGRRTADVETFREALEKIGTAKALAPAVAVKAMAPRQTPTRPAATSSRKKSTASPGGFDSKILVKVVIIIALLFAVKLTWDALKQARIDRDRENREILAKSQEAKEKAKAEAAALREQELAAMLEAKRVAETPVIPTKVESPAESLERLRPRLVSGNRTEMPIGSVLKDGSHYFFVSKPMTWAEAAAFAEDHGGFLPIPEGGRLDSLGEELAKGRAFWVGAGRSGGDSWSLVNGTLWKPEQMPSGSGEYVAMGGTGAYTAESGDAMNSFVIEWKEDGSNPGTLAARLAATRASLDGAEPVYPPGTRSSGDRSYLYVPRPVTWQEASELAQSGGGHLPAVSDAGELDGLATMTKYLKAEDGIWLGGFLENDRWQWVTGEPWTLAAWADGADTGDEESALFIRPGKGWDATDRDDEASGFMIEWSDDAKSGQPAGENVDPGKAAEEFNTRAKDLMAAADKKRAEALKANIEKLTWDLAAFIRGLAKSEQDAWGPHVELLKEKCFEGDRFFASVIEPNGIAVSPEMAKMVTYCIRKQEEADAAFAETAGTIRDGFVAKMGEVRDQAQAVGQSKISENCAESIRTAADLETWVESLGFVVKPEEPEVETDDDSFEDFE